MRTVHSSGRLVGRQEETGRLAGLTAAARAGRGGALVLTGEPGTGKSALLDHARRTADGMRLVRACGSRFEKDLPFAALHQLCLPMLGHLSELPAQQRDALRSAFGPAPGAPDVSRVGPAALDLLSRAARAQPLLCLIDDAHWLDSASSHVLAFLARRIAGEPVAMVFAARPAGAAGEPTEATGLAGLPGLSLSGLSDTDARMLLASLSHTTVDDQVRRRLVLEARGNPLALLEVPSAGGYAPLDTSSVPSPAERGHRSRIEALPAAVRLLLTVASADPTGDAALLWAAARHLGIDATASAEAATATGLAEFATQVRFCHPLARSAVYRAAAPGERRRVHGALAAVTDPATDPDRRAWHRAQAASSPDADIAAELERHAPRAQTRGGTAATAAFLERAAALSPDTAERTARTLAAVRAHIDAGMGERARQLLATVEDTAMDRHRLARVDVLRGQLALLRQSGGSGPVFALRAARRLAEVDPAGSRDHLLDALEMSLSTGRVTGALDVVLAAARTAAPAPRSPDALDAFVRLTTEGPRAAYPLLRRVLDGEDAPMWIRRPALAVVLASELWDPHTHTEITEWLMKTGRASGSPPLLRLGLVRTATGSALSGDLGRAQAAIAEEEAVAHAVGGPPVTYHRLQLAAMRGRRDEAVALFEAVGAAARADGTGQPDTDVHWAAAVLHNGLGEYPAALAAARRAVAHGGLQPAGLVLPELVEAAVRCGEHAAAAAALEPLTESTGAGGTSSGLGIAAYARALVTGREEHYLEAVEHLEKSPLVPYRGRARLLYGEWLRRRGRRRDSRGQLRAAHELLSAAGVEAFARRAADELRATGERAQSRSRAAADRLTEQETHISRLVSTGATSKEIAARLHLSPRTVDAHLRNIFRKLGITSRRQLTGHPALDV